MSGTPHSSAPRSDRRGRQPAVLLVMLLAIGLLAVVLLYQPGRTPPASVPATAESGPAAVTTAANVAVAEARPEYRPLQGRWVREDGGYVIEIRGIAPDGGLEAGYYNPRPIRVARAAAITDGGEVKVLIELRDEGYPGSTYLLTYDVRKDALMGNYFQAATGESFDVIFVRQK
jgi:hypothetical protein